MCKLSPRQESEHITENHVAVVLMLKQHKTEHQHQMARYHSGTLSSLQDNIRPLTNPGHQYQCDL